MDDLYDDINKDDEEEMEEFNGLSDISPEDVNKSFINNEFSDDNTAPMIGEVPENDQYKEVSFEPMSIDNLPNIGSIDDNTSSNESDEPPVLINMSDVKDGAVIPSSNNEEQDDEEPIITNTDNSVSEDNTEEGISFNGVSSYEEESSSFENNDIDNNNESIPTAFTEINSEENGGMPEIKIDDEEFEEEEETSTNETIKVNSDNDISVGEASEEKNNLSEMAFEEVMDEIKGDPVAKEKDDFKCPNCNSIYAGTNICPFCGIEGEEHKKDPESRTADLMIPFKINREEAIKIFKKENKFRLLTPFGYKSKVKKNLVGMYMPYYLFDANVSGAVLYKARDIKKTEDDKYTYKERKNYMVKLSGNFDYDKVLLDVCDKFPDKLNDYIFPYNLEEVVVYDENIIDEYTIVRVNIEDEEMANRIKNKVISSSIAELNKSVRHDKMMVDNNVLGVNIKSFKYVMLPIWLSMSEYKGKKYVYCMNGSSGKYISRVPLDSTKTIVLGLLILLVLFFIGFGIALIL